MQRVPMKRVDSVISLIYSLSKSEKKHFSLQVIKDKEEKDYLVIYDIIIKSKQPNGNIVKEEFYRRNPNGSFEVSIQYLYEKLTDTLLTLRKKKDIYYDLLNDLWEEAGLVLKITGNSHFHKSERCVMV